jgi:hypothetical protein
MQLKDKEFIECLLGSGGIYSKFNENFKRLFPNETYSRSSYYERIKNEPIKAIYESERDYIDDVGESHFLDAMNNGKKWAVRDWLKYRGRYRGYQASIKAEGEILQKVNHTGTITEVSIGLKPEDIQGKSPEKLKALKQAILDLNNEDNSEVIDSTVTEDDSTRDTESDK